MLVSTLRNPLQRNSYTAGSERGRHDRHLDSDRLGSHRDQKYSQGERKDSSSESDRKKHQSPQDSERSQTIKRHEKTRENFHHRARRSSESPEYLNKGKELGRPIERKNGSKRHYSSDRKSCRDESQRSYPKVRKGDERCRDNREESWLSRAGPPSDLSDVYHKDYMEYIQNYKKHMNYFEKMEEKELHQKHSRSYQSEERDTCFYKTKEERHSPESKMHQKFKISKKKRRKISYSESDDNPSSDFPEFGGKCHEKDNSILQSKGKSRNKRKKSNEKLHKSAKKKMKSARNFADSSPKESVNLTEKLESDSSVECDEGLKGGCYSDLSNFTETFSKGKKSKHKKHKDKKRKKYTEEKICSLVT